MKYMCDDFLEVKSEKGNRCSVGVFGQDIYAMKYFVAEAHNCYHCEYFKITKEEFENYPNNSQMLISKYYNGNTLFLCSDYMGNNHITYSFEL